MTMPELPDDPALLAMLEDFDRQMTNEPDLVDKARDSLEDTIKSLKLTPEEERAMADELRQLRELSKKLDDNTVEIAAFGMVSRGKSSVLNALLGRDVFKTGTTHGTTVVKSATDWEQATRRSGLESTRPSLSWSIRRDRRGWRRGREELARDVARRADLILFVVSSDMQRVELEALARLRDAQKPIILVFNQIDRFPDADRDQIYAKIKNERVRRPDPSRRRRHDRRPARPLSGQDPRADGKTTVVWEHPAPDHRAAASCRILDVLEHEGKALVASIRCSPRATCTRRSSRTSSAFETTRPTG